MGLVQGEEKPKRTAVHRREDNSVTTLQWRLQLRRCRPRQGTAGLCMAKVTIYTPTHLANWPLRILPWLNTSRLALNDPRGASQSVSRSVWLITRFIFIFSYPNTSGPQSPRRRPLRHPKFMNFHSFSGIRAIMLGSV